ncbi:efflux RND transporter permease subunit, partial [Kaarinaea lacus]
VSQQSIVTTLSAALSGEDISYLHAGNTKYALPIRLEFSVADKASLDNLLALKVRGNNGSLVSISDVVTLSETRRENAIYHKDLQPVAFVTGDVAGDTDSPLYGMFSIAATVAETSLSGSGTVLQNFINPPSNPYQYTIKWDGEWTVTYETFRDMGIAYSVGLLLIYFLVVGQFKSYVVPLIIMAPIPLTIIGVMPGHALLGAKFTATSMIGMIALAGIIVRNSILLVDFINQQLHDGVDFKEAVIQAGAVRTKPIMLTGLAAMLGALFILDDPIFSGLAISLILGILVSTLLTLVVIPVMYYAFMHRKVASL